MTCPKSYQEWTDVVSEYTLIFVSKHVNDFFIEIILLFLPFGQNEVELCLGYLVRQIHDDELAIGFSRPMWVLYKEVLY